MPEVKNERAICEGRKLGFARGDDILKEVEKSSKKNRQEELADNLRRLIKWTSGGRS